MATTARTAVIGIAIIGLLGACSDDASTTTTSVAGGSPNTTSSATDNGLMPDSVCSTLPSLAPVFADDVNLTKLDYSRSVIEPGPPQPVGCRVTENPEGVDFVDFQVWLTKINYLFANDPTFAGEPTQVSPGFFVALIGDLNGATVSAWTVRPSTSLLYVVTLHGASEEAASAAAVQILTAWVLGA